MTKISVYRHIALKVHRLYIIIANHVIVCLHAMTACISVGDIGDIVT